MKILVCGSTGCVGGALVQALRSRGHRVIEAARGLADGPDSMALDFMRPVSAAAWAVRLRERRIEALVNCVGILLPSHGTSFERVHTAGPAELFEGAACAGVRRVLQVSALGAGDAGKAMPYLHSKRLADESLAGLPIDWAVLRPSLVYGPRSKSAALFATLASLPVVCLPGRGAQPLQPIHVHELAEAAARLLERPGNLRAVLELGGGERLSYRDMLGRYRVALGLGEALWLRVPMAAMRLGAALAERLPQRVFCRDTLRLLERGNVPAANASEALLGRAPAAMAAGLAVTPPEPLLDLRVRLAAPVGAALRASLAFMWLYTAVVSALLRDASGVMELLARCGLTGPAGVAALAGSCLLNASLGLLTLLRPSPLLYLMQCGAITGYTLTAAWHMPELTIDHCGPLVKNLPVLMAVVVLWLAQPPRSRWRASPGHTHAAGAGSPTRWSAA